MFEPIEWSTKIATGIIWQDYQHRQLLGSIDSLQKQISADKEHHENIQIINFLGFYAKDHCGIEEAYMDLMNYPDSDQHKAEHESFIKQIEQLKELRSFSIGINTEALYKDLAGWFVMHINNTDQKFGAFLKSNGIR
jgi:hemerythrin-like metal-binding protein